MTPTAVVGIGIGGDGFTVIAAIYIGLVVLAAVLAIYIAYIIVSGIRKGRGLGQISALPSAQLMRSLGPSTTRSVSPSRGASIVPSRAAGSSAYAPPSKA